MTLIKRHLKENLQEWVTTLAIVLWAYHMSKRTSMSPFTLTYGQEVVIPLEITIQSLQVQLQSDILHEEYNELIYMNVDELDYIRTTTLDHVLA